MVLGKSPSAQLPPHKEPCSVQPGFDRSFAQSHYSGDSLGAQPFHITQHQRDPVLLGQLVDGVIERLAQFLVFERLLRREALDRNLQAEFTVRRGDEFFQRELPLRRPFPLATQAHGCPRCNGIQPRGHLRVAAKCVHAAKGIQKGFLDEVVRRLHVSTKPIGVAINEIHMVSIQLIKRLRCFCKWSGRAHGEGSLGSLTGGCQTGFQNGVVVVVAGPALLQAAGLVVFVTSAVTRPSSICKVKVCPTFTRGFPHFEVFITTPTGVLKKTKFDFSFETEPVKRTWADDPAVGVWLICRSNCRSWTPMIVCDSSTSTVN